MAMVYLIGGAPRTGKSTVLEQLIKRKPMPGASTDAIRTTAKAMTTPEDSPRYYKVGRGEFYSPKNVSRMLKTPDKSLKYELAEAEETWQSTLSFLSYYQRDGRDAAIEGVGVMPAQLAKAEFPYRAVFLTMTGDYTDSIVASAQKYKNDWLHKHDEKTIRAFASMNQLWNEYYAQEAITHGFDVIEMRPNEFEKSSQKAVKTLLGEQ